MPVEAINLLCQGDWPLLANLQFRGSESILPCLPAHWKLLNFSRTPYYRRVSPEKIENFLMNKSCQQLEMLNLHCEIWYATDARPTQELWPQNTTLHVKSHHPDAQRV